MTTTAIRQQLHNYIDKANDRKIKAIFTILEPDMEDPVAIYDKWEDPEFVAEMERRAKALEDGTDKGFTWEEVQERTRQALKQKSKK